MGNCKGRGDQYILDGQDSFLRQEHLESEDLRQGSSMPGLSSKPTLKLSGCNFL